MNSQFDGSLAFAGGGFMPSQSTNFSADPYSSSSSKNRDSQPLLPLTIKQISEGLQCSDDKANFLIDGVDVNNVTLVGMVFNKTERITEVAFVLNDGTGLIDCMKWSSEPADNKEMDGILWYVCTSPWTFEGLPGQKAIVGVLYQQNLIHYWEDYIMHLSKQGKLVVHIFEPGPLDDCNEIPYHFVECMYVHNYNIKSRMVQTGGPMPNTAIKTPTKEYQSAPPSQYSGAGISGMGARKGINQMVIEYLQQPQCLSREKGVPINEIAQHLSTPAEKVTISIKTLEDEGLVYSTIDDHHYKSTGNA